MRRNNECNIPLEGKPEYSSAGIIKVVDSQKRNYAVAEIIYDRFDDQNFQYTFVPFWNSIDALPSMLFHGIPGLDLSLRKEQYYRVNMTPTFIEMRSPGPGREDLWDLLEEEGMDYYDRFEWLLRTSKRCGDDNLIVERKRNQGQTIQSINSETLNHLQPADFIILSSLSDITGKEKNIAPELMQLLCSGADITVTSDCPKIDEQGKRLMMYLLKSQMTAEYLHAKRKQLQGIAKAKNERRYTGRKRIETDPLLAQEVFRAFEEKRISEQEAMEKLQLPSRSTFYRRMKEYRNQTTSASSDAQSSPSVEK